MIPWWKKALSYFSPVVVERQKGVLHRELRLVYTRGHLEVEGEDANYSFGTNHDAWHFVLRQTKEQWERGQCFLILGFGCGTIASLIDGEARHIVGVEKEKVLLEWFNTHFAPMLKGRYRLVCGDALEFIQETKHRYDGVLIDLFVGTRVPSSFLSIAFLEAVLSRVKEGGVVIMNVLEIHWEQLRFARDLQGGIGGTLLSYYPNLFWVFRKGNGFLNLPDDVKTKEAEREHDRNDGTGNAQ